MPYLPHILATFGGNLPGGEEWQLGIRFARFNGGTTPTTVTGIAASLHPLFRSFFTDADTGIDQRATFLWTKVAPIGPDGNYIGEPDLFEVAAPGAAGGAGTGSFPNQVALVVSTLTGFTLGDATRGRFYLPLPAIAAGSDGAISSAAAGAVAQNAADLVSSLNEVMEGISPAHSAAVLSQKGSGSARAIIQCGVGRALDTQRRRRRNLNEAPVVVALD